MKKLLIFTLLLLSVVSVASAVQLTKTETPTLYASFSAEKRGGQVAVTVTALRYDMLITVTLTAPDGTVRSTYTLAEGETDTILLPAAGNSLSITVAYVVRGEELREERAGNVLRGKITTLANGSVTLPLH